MSFKLSLLKPNIQLPLVVESEEESIKTPQLQNLLNGIIANKSFLEQKLLQHGGILFRGFPLGTAEDFNAVVRTIEPSIIPYIEGQSPRTKVHDQIYTSTEYPAGNISIDAGKEAEVNLDNAPWLESLDLGCTENENLL